MVLLHTQVRSFTDLPALPERFGRCGVVQQLWWTWHAAAIELFRRLDLDLWRELRHNPVGHVGAHEKLSGSTPGPDRPSRLRWAGARSVQPY
jgi:hypothetical protein